MWTTKKFLKSFILPFPHIKHKLNEFLDWIRRPSGRVTPIVESEDPVEINTNKPKWRGSPISASGGRSITEDERRNKWLSSGEQAALRDFDDTTYLEEDEVHNHYFFCPVILFFTNTFIKLGSKSYSLWKIRQWCNLCDFIFFWIHPPKWEWCQ